VCQPSSGGPGNIPQGFSPCSVADGSSPSLDPVVKWSVRVPEVGLASQQYRAKVSGGGGSGIED